MDGVALSRTPRWDGGEFSPGRESPAGLFILQWWGRFFDRYAGGASIRYHLPRPCFPTLALRSASLPKALPTDLLTPPPNVFLADLFESLPKAFLPALPPRCRLFFLTLPFHLFQPPSCQHHIALTFRNGKSPALRLFLIARGRFLERYPGGASILHPPRPFLPTLTFLPASLLAPHYPSLLVARLVALPPRLRLLFLAVLLQLFQPATGKAPRYGYSSSQGGGSLNDTPAARASSIRRAHSCQR